MTLEDSLGATTSEIGFQVQSSSFLQINISEINYQHQTELASISGVDLNEEMINLSQYQKSYEAAVQGNANHGDDARRAVHNGSIDEPEIIHEES